MDLSSLSSRQLRQLAESVIELQKRGIDPSKVLAPAQTVEVTPLWTPRSEPQKMAYDSLADELFYGGAAAGGKSDLLLGVALTQLYKSIIFRVEYPQLKDLIDRSRAIIGEKHGRYNANERIWRLSKQHGGRILEFGAIQYEADVTKFQGRPHGGKLFDELPNFSETKYRYLNGWKRSAEGHRTRTIGAGNPPSSAEGEWVIKRWRPWLDKQHSNPAIPGELRWFVSLGDEDLEVEDNKPYKHKKDLLMPTSRTFIPARVQDNPFFSSGEYERNLQSLPEPLRSQLLFGDFSVGREDDIWQVIPTEWVRAAQERWEADGRELHPKLSALGVDISRGGRDKTVLSARYGNWYAAIEKHRGVDVPNGDTAAQLIFNALGNNPTATVNIDGIGVGAAAYDACKRLGINVKSIIFSEGAKNQYDKTGKLKFKNLRAMAYWRMREALEPTYGQNLSLPPDQELLADLTAPKWTMTVGGIQIESKDDIKQRIGRSPDCGDAVVLANMGIYRKPLIGFI